MPQDRAPGAAPVGGTHDRPEDGGVDDRLRGVGGVDHDIKAVVEPLVEGLRGAGDGRGKPVPGDAVVGRLEDAVAAEGGKIGGRGVAENLPGAVVPGAGVTGPGILRDAGDRLQVGDRVYLGPAPT